MAHKSPGSFRLFQAFGIDVFVHWSWFVVAIFLYQRAAQDSYFHAPIWHAIVYLALFAIVTLHEFGHALACRSVGGRANRIILWPLGGIAFVQPPQRPGAMLWSIAAGPLVNVALVPITLAGAWMTGVWETPRYFWTDPQAFAAAIVIINAALLVFNLLPIYPLDGGQILQSILWYFIGQGKSLWATAIVGLVGAVAGGVYALTQHAWILLAIAVFVGYQAYHAFRAGRMMDAMDQNRRLSDDRARDIAGIDR